ncbi:uncharacterized protein DUF4402 [Jejuia pallidilutea]|uniref:Uncharacterized protein DUF4402 n=2 Tax=Jejuia pallidilutea TaxID=504487 RepID=A0A362X183_9FLAO|nr:uncharacterized protein DUF4402 [Jejuia pallidilutea]
MAYMLWANYGAQAQTASSTSTAVIVQPISIYSFGSVLNFGAFTPDPLNPSTLTLTPESSTSASKDYASNLILHEYSDRAAGSFYVEGAPGAAFIVSLPESATLTNENTDTMTVTDFTVAEAYTFYDEFESTNVFNIDDDGELPILVAGTLNIGAAQPSGNYSGNYLVTVNYQ